MGAKKKDVTVTETSEPNIAFVGERFGYEPLTKISDGEDVISLPADQDKPFYHEDARRIVRLFPRIYKHYTTKGR